jgi:hypothetical protein
VLSNLKQQDSNDQYCEEKQNTGDVQNKNKKYLQNLSNWDLCLDPAAFL